MALLKLYAAFSSVQELCHLLYREKCLGTEVLEESISTVRELCEHAIDATINVELSLVIDSAIELKVVVLEGPWVHSEVHCMHHLNCL